MKILNTTDFTGTYNGKEYRKVILTVGDKDHFPRNLNLDADVYDALVKKYGYDLKGGEYDPVNGVVYRQEYGKFKIANIILTK